MFAEAAQKVPQIKSNNGGSNLLKSHHPNVQQSIFLMHEAKKTESTAESSCQIE